MDPAIDIEVYGFLRCKFELLWNVQQKGESMLLWFCTTQYLSFWFLSKAVILVLSEYERNNHQVFQREHPFASEEENTSTKWHQVDNKSSAQLAKCKHRKGFLVLLVSLSWDYSLLWRSYCCKQPSRLRCNAAVFRSKVSNRKWWRSNLWALPSIMNLSFSSFDGCDLLMMAACLMKLSNIWLF